MSAMTEADLLQIVERGEDSRHQFKRDETNADSIAAELAAFANSGGGVLFLGVEDKGRVAGLDAANVRRLNQLLSNAASQNVRPPIHPTTENIQTAQGIVIAVTVPDGLSKPYLDNQGRIWVTTMSYRFTAGEYAGRSETVGLERVLPAPQDCSL